MRLILGAAAMLMAASCASTPADDSIVNPATLEAELSAMVADGSAAGVSALVFEDGREAFAGAYGMADKAEKRPMRRDTLVQVFSMTKPVTGVALMQLYEQGKFSLDDPITKYVPELVNLKIVGPNGGLVAPDSLPTVRHIMSHSAGFTSDMGNDTPDETAYRRIKPVDLAKTPTQMAEAIARTPLAYQPGTQWRYSDVVDIQALMVERLSGQSFEAYALEHVINPLGMNDTGWRLPADKRERLALPYGPDDAGALQPVPIDRFRRFDTGEAVRIPGSWGLVSSLDNYMRFARMLQNEGELDGVRILKPETVALMATNVLPDSMTERSWLPGKGQQGFGLDFAVRTAPPQTDDENYGAVGEFFWDGYASTLFWVDPENDLTAVFFVQKIPFDGSLHYRIRNAVYDVVERDQTGD